MTPPHPDPPPRGIALLHNPALNKGTAFSPAERDALGLRGLLPPRVFRQDEQLERILGSLRGKSSDLEKYIYLVALQDRNETLFYRTIVDHVTEMMPLIYTPTVGEACRHFGHIFRRPRGLYITAEDRGRIADVLRNWPERNAAVIVVTDGERILGLGDLGAYGMGIPIGKLALYTALAGIHPRLCLPVMFDVGTDRAELLDDTLYTGLRQRRLRGAAYDDLMEEFMVAVGEVFPSALIQFEDFATHNAFGLLSRYRDRVLCFNDDIQGTAAVTLAGLLSASRIIDRPLTEHTILFLGAGAAAAGIADLIVTALVKRGLDAEAARARIWFIDSRGLVVQARDDLAPHKRPYAHDHAHLPSLEAAVSALRPGVLIGVSGQSGAFSESILRSMASAHERPIVFALSNPTSNAECTAEEAYRATDGQAVFASGSPFDPVVIDGRRHVPGQGNNAYVFPGIGLGVLAAGARLVTDEMFYGAAVELADQAAAMCGEDGCVFPPLTAIREVSARIATAVAEEARRSGLASRDEDVDLAAHVRSLMWEPHYEEYA